MKRYFIISLLTLVAILGMWSCTKHDGYYEYVNSENTYQGSTIGYFESKKGVFDSLMVVLNKFPEVKSRLENEEVTVFAPTNSSFELALFSFNLVRQNQGKAKMYLKDLNEVHLDTLVNMYLVKGKVSTDEMLFVDGLYVETLNYGIPMHAQRLKEEASGLVDGGLVRVYYSLTNFSTFESQWTRSQSQAVNIKTENGIVHILSNGHEFGFGEFLKRFNR